MKRSRIRIGKPLLVASSTLTIACSGLTEVDRPVGNLMAPPSKQICVTTTPANASVTINGAPADENGCAWVNGDEATVSADHPRYEDSSQTLTLVEDKTSLNIQLQKEPPRPVGNLMAPPPKKPGPVPKKDGS